MEVYKEIKQAGGGCLLENADRTKEAVIQWIKDFFSRNAPDASAVIGISGGKDSSVAAALCAEALGNCNLNTDKPPVADCYENEPDCTVC